MFESVVAALVKRFLGRYIKNFDSKTLDIELLKGKVSLYNLEIMKTTFQEMEFFITLESGKIGVFDLEIPWILGGAPVMSHVRDVEMKILIQQPTIEEASRMKLSRLEDELMEAEKSIESTKKQIELEKANMSTMNEKRLMGIDVSKEKLPILERIGVGVAQKLINAFNCKIENIRVDIEARMMNIDPINLTFNLDLINIS
jgi:hypothetical protein